jgi:hypothetical protein
VLQGRAGLRGVVGPGQIVVTIEISIGADEHAPTDDRRHIPTVMQPVAGLVAVGHAPAKGPHVGIDALLLGPGAPSCLVRRSRRVEAPDVLDFRLRLRIEALEGSRQIEPFEQVVEPRPLEPADRSFVAAEDPRFRLLLPIQRSRRLRSP